MKTHDILSLGMLEYTIVTEGDYVRISYGDTHDRISYGNYDWFYTPQFYKVLQDDKSDLAIALILPESKDTTRNYAINLVKPVTVGFYTDKEPKQRVMILSAHHNLSSADDLTTGTLLDIRPECFLVLGQDYKAKVTEFINDENISKLKHIVREHYAKKTDISNSD